MNGVRISVIIPFFNASLYLERCVKSLFEQTLESIEFIFIDDCSIDNSVEILEEVVKQYPTRMSAVRLIRHTENKGSASSRNSGLELAVGKYIAWTDADDWVEPKMFEQLYEVAEGSNADLVWCNFFIEFDDCQVEDQQQISEDSKLYSKALIQGTMQGMLWNKLIKRDLFDMKKIRFLDGCNMAEDRNVLFKLLCFSKKIMHLPIPFYHYIQHNPNSLTRDIRSERVYEEIENAKDIASFIEINNIDWISNLDLDNFKFNVKKKLLFSLSLEDFKIWRVIFSESNYSLYRAALPLRHKCLAFFSVNKLWLFVRGWIFFKTKINSIE